MSSFKLTSKLTKEAVINLNYADKTYLLILKWIKAQLSHIGNERADEAALALETGDLLPFSLKIVTNNLKAGFMKSWQEKWLNKTDCRQTKQWFPTVHKQHTDRKHLSKYGNK